MLALPDFDDAGNLPEGHHAANLDEVEEAFVLAFPGSRTRRLIFDWWVQHRAALVDLCGIDEQWLGGSFVGDKEHPNDVDLVTVLDADSYDELADPRRLVVTSLVRGNYTEDFWRCDAWPIFTYEDHDQARDAAVLARGWFDDHFGTDRDGRSRGFVVVEG